MSHGEGLPLKEVRELSKLLAAQLADGEEVEKCVSKPATALGDNYGSTMLALDIVIRKQASERHLFAFCKMLPEDPVRRALFSVDVTFIKEMEMYTLAVPAMQQLQLDNHVPDDDLISHLVPKCYGGRVSLEGEAVDDDAALLLEDMRQRGFAPGNRFEGMDLQSAKLILEKLAVFHALPIALRRKRPQIYERTVLRACRDFKMGGELGTEAFGEVDKFKNCILANVKKSPKASRHLETVIKQLESGKLGKDEEFPAIREPFATFFHNDLWTNNVLLRKEKVNGPAVEVAFIDFQISRLNSPFKDVLFFLFTSVHMDATANHFDELLEAYHTSFCRCLSQVGVDTAPFSLSAAREEMDALAHTELFHILFMLRWITAEPETIRANPETYVYMEELGGDNYAKRVEHVVLQYAKHGWL